MRCGAGVKSELELVAIQLLVQLSEISDSGSVGGKRLFLSMGS